MKHKPGVTVDEHQAISDEFVDDPGEEDGVWAEGWSERSGRHGVIAGIDLASGPDVAVIAYFDEAGPIPEDLWSRRLGILKKD